MTLTVGTALVVLAVMILGEIWRVAAPGAVRDAESLLAAAWCCRGGATRLRGGGARGEERAQR